MLKKIYGIFENICFFIRRFRIICLYLLHYGNIKGLDLGYGVRIEENVDLYFRNHGTLSIKGKTMICKYSKIVINGGNLNLGERCTFGANNIFNVFDDIRIGSSVITADKVSFITNIHEYKNILLPISEQGGVQRPSILVVEPGLD